MTSVRHHLRPLPRIAPAVRDAWHGIGTAAASDVMGRAGAMSAAIGPLDPGMTCVGRARTVRTMVGDNSTIHAALSLAEPGDVLVIDAQGFADVAVWGELLSRAARHAGLAGAVIDGAVRDRNAVVGVGPPVYCRAVVPRGPHKGFGGEIDAEISCGGLHVNPGDLVLGDGDGVVIVPHQRIAATLEAAQALTLRESRIAERLEAGESLSEIFGAPPITPVGTRDDRQP